MHRCKILLLFAFLLFGQTAAMAAEPAPLQPLNMELRYDGRFLGLKLGRLRVTMKEDATSYDIQLDTKLSGLARMISQMRTIAGARGIKQGAAYLPQYYISTEEKNGDPKALEAWIRYDETGKVAERFRKPMDDPNWRAVVPMAEAVTGVDPISALMMLRPLLQETLAHNATQTHVRTYDAARLAQMNFRVVGKKNIEVLHVKTPVIETVLTRTLLNGYTPKEEAKFKEGDPEVRIYFTDDARLLPVQATIALPAGVFVIELAEMK